jgi:Skp family chaperone for outer membrane proteins
MGCRARLSGRPVADGTAAGSSLYEERQTVKRTVAYLTAVLALGGVIVYATSGLAQQGNNGQGAAGGAAAQPQRSKIALKEYKRANAQGQEIATKRKQYLDQVNALRTAINDKNKQIADPKTPQDVKERLQREMVQANRQIEDIDRTAQKELGEISNNTIVKVYSEITEITKAFAEAYGFELVLAYPDATSATEANTPVVAQLKLQTPALMPFYVRPGIDISDSVIKALNERYPAPEAKAPAPGSSGVTPASGTSTPR